jgi:hypothetical protein
MAGGRFWQPHLTGTDFLPGAQKAIDDNGGVDFDTKGYVWVITRNRAEWKELSVGADNISKAVATLRFALDPESPTR